MIDGNFIIYRGDLKPDLKLRLTNDGVAIDLTAADSVRVIGIRGATRVIDEVVSNVTADGWLTMNWKASHTAQSGEIKVEAEVMWAGAKPQTFRPDGVIKVVADYG